MAKKKNKIYFGEEQEQAVIDYLNTENTYERNIIFNEKLKAPFKKMVESIIKTYKLFPKGEDIDVTVDDTFSFLITKMDKFIPGESKAYSYYGTICKRYLLGRREKGDIEMKRNPSYEDIASDIEDNIVYTDVTDRNKEIAIESINHLIDKINEMIQNPSNYSLKEGDIKLGEALITLFENWDYVITTNKTNNLNKNAILLFLRDTTKLDQKQVRDGLKKYKKEFKSIKNFIINN